MKSKKYFIGLLSSFMLFTCASIPSSTVTLTQGVIQEANEMHQLNIALLNQLFEERKNQVNTFINDHYIPAFVNNFESDLPTGVDYKTQLPDILKSVMPVIDKKRDSLYQVLDAEKKSVLASINKSYASYQNASNSLQSLINSVVKLESSEKAIVSRVESLTHTSIDVSKIEQQLDSLLIKSGNGFKKMLDINSELKNN